MNVIRFVFCLLLLVTFFCQSCHNLEKSGKRQLSLEFKTPSNRGELYGDVFLMDKKDTTYHVRYPIHKEWAYLLQNKIFPNQKVDKVNDNWTCEIKNSTTQHDITSKIEDFTGFDEILSVAFEQMSIRDEQIALDFIINKLFTPNLYQESHDDNWEECEKKYRYKIQRVINDSDGKNFENTPYKLIGLNSCQLFEILSIDSIVNSLKQHQYIITPSSCILHEVENIREGGMIVTKPYYLIEFDDKGKYLSVRIELINKLYYYSWINL